MKRSKIRQIQKYLIVLGSAIATLPTGLLLYWGNLTVYASSYLIFCGESAAYNQTPLVLSIYIIAGTVTLLLHSNLRKLLGPTWIPILGIVLSGLGMFLSYFTVQKSMWWLVLTTAVVFGFGTGTLTGWTLDLIGEWADDDLAFLFAIINGASNIGAMVINEIITAFINPSGLQTDFQMGGSRYFSQVKILDKVPSVFLIIGSFTMACCAIGFAIVKIVTCYVKHGEKDDASTKKENTEYGSNNQTPNDTDLIEAAPLSTIVDNAHRPENETATSQSNQSSSNVTRDYTPKEVLHCSLFYVLLISFFFSELPFLLVLKYYKFFGQVWIHDDHFLTNTGTARSFCNIFGRLLGGLAMDKLGVKNTIMPVILVVMLTCLWYFFTPLVSKWLFFVIAITLSLVAASYYHSFVGIAASIFGRKHLSINYGLLRSSSLVLNIVAPFVLEAVLVNLGWFYAFAIPAALNLISLILLGIFMPNV